ncbi:MAG: 4Fe-4S dicluster domain-containing protein [Planctomycetes bacterium]|nr:4Fe-4S dicluster domain-containing protein [Planctomycetota bacterium]
MEWEWKLIREACTGCGISADVCTVGAIRMTREMPYPEPVPLNCTFCLDCPDECPFDAIEIHEVRLAAFK